MSEGHFARLLLGQEASGELAKERAPYAQTWKPTSPHPPGALAMALNGALTNLFSALNAATHAGIGADFDDELSLLPGLR